MAKYTKLETKVLEALKKYNTENGTYTYIEDTYYDIRLPVETIKGILGSLVKKGAIDIDEGLLTIFDDDYRVEG